MAQPTVKTIQYVDPRIEPQPDPVYDYVIGPTQNQFYRIASSGISQSSITFNNLTTLGADRAYLDTFEIELEIEIIFKVDLGTADKAAHQLTLIENSVFPRPDMWTFQSWPLATVTEETRVNINGGAFYSQPMSYIRAKERYMNQEALNRCYQNICPVQKPICQTESGIDYNKCIFYVTKAFWNYPMVSVLTDYTGGHAQTVNVEMPAVPTRYGRGLVRYGQSPQGMDGGFNNSIIDLGEYKDDHYENYYFDASKNETHVKVRWREPIFCSPFSSKYDATYGRPLYNITSMDIALNLTKLENMIRVCNYPDISLIDAQLSTYAEGDIRNFPHVTSYSIELQSAMLCYQVMTIPAILQKPLTTLVPYRRFVPYVSEINTTGQLGGGRAGAIDVDGQTINVRSGVYTMNEVPTAIWAYIGPTRGKLQSNSPDYAYQIPANETEPSSDIDKNLRNGNYYPSWDTNKLFAFIEHVNISMANTTQILNTARPYDLYRIAKANGCEDSWWSWYMSNTCIAPKQCRAHQLFPPCSTIEALDDGVGDEDPSESPIGAGSVLRMKPGVDLIVPDIPLIPGANASNMVFQCEMDASIPYHSVENSDYALWLLFEYVGVAAISPGQCEITMNPLGSGEIMAVSPIASATSEATEGKLEGSGFWDEVKKNTRIARQIADEGILSRILKHIPGAEKAAEWLAKKGLGEIDGCAARKRPRISGGAVMGKGLNDWI